MNVVIISRYQNIIDDVGALKWSDLTRQELMAVAQAYYYFSVQFCETVEIASALYPEDPALAELRAGEIDTDNLSPYPGIAAASEKMSHYEFMRRVVAMSSLDQEARAQVDKLGQDYLAEVRRFDPTTRAMSLATYEDGGLEKTFRAILAAKDWDHPSLGAFRHFLVGHILLDSDPEAGHGALCRHIAPDERVAPLWTAFRALLVGAAPALAN